MKNIAVGDIVSIDGVKCEIVSIEIYDGELDYLCRPLDTSKLVLGQSELGAGWVRAENIEEV